MITARSQEEDRSIGEETGADEYITKPFEISEVIDYWIYDLNFGSKYYDGCITEKDGTNIVLKTAENLYDYLIEEMQKNEN